MSYTKEMTQEILEAYEASPNRDTVDKLAEKYDKSVKSIIGKLSREGVYRREVYTTKTGSKPITKLELLAEVAELLELEDWQLHGFDKTPKQTMKNIKDKIEELLGDSVEED